MTFAFTKSSNVPSPFWTAFAESISFAPALATESVNSETNASPQDLQQRYYQAISQRWGPAAFLAIPIAMFSLFSPNGEFSRERLIQRSERCRINLLRRGVSAEVLEVPENEVVSTLVQPTT